MPGLVPTIASEDETTIKKIVHYNSKTDELIGFCGKMSNSHHVCDPSLHVMAGDDYENLLKTFQVFYLIFLQYNNNPLIINGTQFLDLHGAKMMCTML